mmetsp:Transcript_26374/g.78308  ORF Transcript_26374/g.78308 Transcript_26374/m.78308 type:complete len:85 (-) Transcript_26374:215-469(-)
MYTLASCTDTAAIANRCSSPPERFSTLRSVTWISSSSSMSCSIFPLASRSASTERTLPRTALGMWSTYCGLMTGFRLSSSTLVK